jgi:predicted lipoprotein with Yx(FWY)xxD motif
MTEKSYKSDYTEGIGKTTYFTDDRGVTLYTFKLDSLNKNKFTKPDFSNNNVWPIYETNKIVVPSTVDKTKFGSINVFGKTQLTYNGWPLYYFGQDGQTRGFNKGISFQVREYGQYLHLVLVKHRNKLFNSVLT